MRTILLFLFTVTSLTLCLGHGGGTDSRGGHNDRKNGGYHFHHGMSAHQHPGGACPYAPKPKPVPAPTPIAKPKPEPTPAISSHTNPSKFTKENWQVAFNAAEAKGKLNVITNAGRVDILTNEYAIKVDSITNYGPAILEALRYAKGTKEKPGLAIYIDGDKDAFELYSLAAEQCQRHNIKLWLINSYVSSDKVLALQTQI